MSTIGYDEKKEVGYILVRQDAVWSERGSLYRHTPALSTVVLQVSCNCFTLRCFNGRLDRTRQAASRCSHNRPRSPASETVQFVPRVGNVGLTLSQHRFGGSAVATTFSAWFSVAKLVWSSASRLLTQAPLAFKTWSSCLSKQYLRHIIHRSHTHRPLLKSRRNLSST